MSASTQQHELDPGLKAVLGRIRNAGRGRVPFIQQMEKADCGVACLTMTLAYLGKTLSLQEVRQSVGGSRGIDALSLLQAAEVHGLIGRGVQLEPDEIGALPRGAILHWDFTHFVVLDAVKRKHIEIVDPAFGPRRIPIERFRRHFTGVALVFEPAATFAKASRRPGNSWKYLGQLLGQRSLLARVLVSSVLLRVLALALPLITGAIVDRVIPRTDSSLLLVVGYSISILLFLQFFLSFIRSHILIELRTRTDSQITFGFLSHLLALPYSYFRARPAGDLMLRVHSNTQIREILTSSLLSALLDGLLAFAYFAVLLYLSPLLAVVTSAIASIQIAIVLLSRRRQLQLLATDLEGQARVQSYLVQMLVGIETLKCAGAEGRALEVWANGYSEQLNVALSRSRLTALTDAANNVLQVGGPMILLAVGALQVIDHKLSLGLMLATTAMAASFLGPLTTLLQNSLQLHLLSSYVARIDDVFLTEPEQRQSNNLLTPRLSGRIEISHLSFRYAPNAPWALRDVSVTIEPGTMVAIVGRSGSGKSTLAALLLGLYPPTEGNILYDGVGLTELNYRRLRQQVGAVPQAPFIFSGSVRTNIALVDPSIATDRIIRAARKACLHEDIRAMPMGYDTIVASGGSTLSGGQRQRLALARALVHDPPILLLDEATSALDAETERRVMENLSELQATRVVIAHRLSTVIDADRIIVMDEGRIVESGSHAELMERGTVYRALVARQTLPGHVSR